MYVFKKKDVLENAAAFALYNENNGPCTNQGVCGKVNAVCVG